MSGLRRTLILVGCAALVATPVALGATHPQTAQPTIDKQIVAQLNSIRAKNHLPALKLNAGLNSAAKAHTSEMGAKGYFEHNSADGTAFGKRIMKYYKPRVGGSWSVAENIAWGQGTLSAKKIVAIWMGNAAHRVIILDSTWREIGVSTITERNAPGAFGGKDVTITTADFGVH